MRTKFIALTHHVRMTVTLSAIVLAGHTAQAAVPASPIGGSSKPDVHTKIVLPIPVDHESRILLEKMNAQERRSLASATDSDQGVVRLDLKVEFNGQHKFESALTAKLGQSVTYGEMVGGKEKYFVTLTATKNEQNHIFIEAKLGEVIDGKRVVLQTPNIIALEKQPALIESFDAANNKVYGFSVQATTLR